VKRMGVKANMRLDHETIDQVLAAVRRGKLSWVELPPDERDAADGSTPDVDLQGFMKSRGVEAWHPYFVKHTCVEPIAVGRSPKRTIVRYAMW
jgi:hypothetical protein